MDKQSYNQFSKEEKHKEEIISDENHIEMIQIKEKKRDKKKHISVSSPLRYIVFISTLWIVFTISFILGFILHYDLQSDITFSSILWTFSTILFIIATIYTTLFYKARNSVDYEKKVSYLKFFPV
jgi:hypothetical protein